MEGIFYGCSSLKSIDVSSFKLLMQMIRILYSLICITLKYVDISSFNIQEDFEIIFMSNGCSFLKTKKLNKNWKNYNQDIKIENIIILIIKWLIFNN